MPLKNIEENDTRIKKLADYLKERVEDVLDITAKDINANMLSKNIGNYSLDKIPTESVVEKWITGIEVCKDVFSFRSRNEYSPDMINNLKNIGFFEKFENVIKTNNKEGVLPEINGIQSIECLNCGTMNNAKDNTAEFDIQIQITYINKEE